MRDITTLQERIELRCRERAKSEAKRLWDSLPYMGDLEVYYAPSAGRIVIGSDQLQSAMKEVMEKKLFTRYVNAECEKLLAAVDQIDETLNIVHNLQQRS